MHWLQRRLSSNQWLVERNNIITARCEGFRPRVLLSRGLCLYYLLDLGKIPATRRTQALRQQVRLLSPFAEPGHYVRWQGGHAQLWLWDQAALLARLPQAAHATLLPDSALAEPRAEGECWLKGLDGAEWQCWQQGRLTDSRWQPAAPAGAQTRPINTQQAAPLQAADRRLLVQLALCGVAAILTLSLLLQTGGALSLWQQQQQLQTDLATLEQDGQLQFQARRRAQQTLAQWQARQALQRPPQLEFIQLLAAAVPDNASFWQRYHFEPGQLQLQLRDDKPDPRDYVRRLSGVPGISNVQVRLDPGNERVVVQAELNNKEQP